MRKLSVTQVTIEEHFHHQLFKLTQHVESTMHFGAQYKRSVVHGAQ